MVSWFPVVACLGFHFGGVELALILVVVTAFLALTCGPPILCLVMAARRHRRFAWLGSYRRLGPERLEQYQGELVEVQGTVADWRLAGKAWQLLLRTEGGEQIEVRELQDVSQPAPLDLPDWECLPGQRVAVVGRVQTVFEPDGYREVRGRLQVEAVQVQPCAVIASWRARGLGWLGAGVGWVVMLAMLWQRVH